LPKEAITARVRDSIHADTGVQYIVWVGLRIDRGAVSRRTPTEDVGRAHAIRLSAIRALPAAPAIPRTGPGVTSAACHAWVRLAVVRYTWRTTTPTTAAGDDD